MDRILQSISQAVTRKKSWALLSFSALCLIASALYFQHSMGLEPCIMCIYQRTAMFGVFIFAALPIFAQLPIVRAIAFAGWGVSAIWGWMIASEHVGIQTATNPFFASCEIIPNFPEFAPLHEWLPNLFAATGSCGDIDWSFMGMSMPEWMQVIFAFYSVLLFVILIPRLMYARKI